MNISLKRSLSLLFVISAICISSCKHDPIIPLEQAAPVSFQTDIQPIIVTNCTQSGCHENLGTYAELMEMVEPSDPNDSELYEYITRNDEERMPLPPNAPLTDDQIKLIYLWIAQGAQNN